MTEQKKGKKTKLSKKLLWALLGAFVGSAMAVSFVGYILSLPLGKSMMSKAMYVSQLVILVLLVITFYRIVDRMIIHRLQELSDAMAQVADGNYDIMVDVKGHDELSGLTESFNKMTNELKMNAFLSKDFARYVSHEFKTPLFVIRSYAEITQDESTESETVKNMDVIISEADRLTGLSKDILELCKLDSTTIVEKKEHFSPAAQIRSIILDLQLLWGEKNIEMIPELEEFEITSNEALLFRVWHNIIINAIKFTGQDGCISVKLKKNIGDFSCEIADNGVGISDEDKEYLFTPFHTGNGCHNKEGSGLGLSLSKKIVEKLGGTIVFESEAGKGSIFIVTIPY